MLRRLLLVLLCVTALTGCPSPAAPPAPPAEVPSLLTIPGDLSIDVEELPSAATSALKLQVADPDNIQSAIELSIGAIEESNLFLDIALLPASKNNIPVGADVFTFESTVPITEDEAVGVFTFKFDFGRFDLDGDGALEDCTGCTCPVGCSPDVTACPTEAPVTDLKPVCVRAWLDGERFLAAVFDKVPTADNAQSGKLRIALPSFGDLAGSPFSIAYDHSDPNDRRTDLSAFFKDDDSGTDEGFFAKRHTFARSEGPEETARKTAKITTSFLEPASAIPGTLRFQSAYFAHLDFIALEALADGAFSDDPDVGFFGIADITPPICALISTSNPVADVLCSDLGLSLTPGDFLDSANLGETTLPPASQFPETPAF